MEGYSWRPGCLPQITLPLQCGLLYFVLQILVLSPDDRYPAIQRSDVFFQNFCRCLKSLLLRTAQRYGQVVETGPASGHNASAISSYAVLANWPLSPISTSVPTLGAATCWSVVTPDGHFVYTSNAGSATISGFAIGGTGTDPASASSQHATIRSFERPSDTAWVHPDAQSLPSPVA